MQPGPVDSRAPPGSLPVPARHARAGPAAPPHSYARQPPDGLAPSGASAEEAQAGFGEVQALADDLLALLQTIGAKLRTAQA
ncbi:MAG: hypothetical protein WKG07_39310 [Hymenobacter sp.]